MAALRSLTPDFRQTCPRIHQLPSNKKQVAKGEQRKEPCAVLGEIPITGLDVSELALDHPEGVLNPSPHLGDDPVDVFIDRMQCTGL